MLWNGGGEEEEEEEEGGAAGFAAINSRRCRLAVELIQLKAEFFVVLLQTFGCVKCPGEGWPRWPAEKDYP